MGIISAQVSLYPLRMASIGPVIDEVVSVLGGPGLETQMGEMSTVVWGEERSVFAALQEAFHRAAEQADVVMVVTLSNACPERGRATCPSPQEP